MNLCFKIKNKITKYRFLSILLSMLLLTSCVETVIVGSFGTGIIALREKTIEDTASDTLIASNLVKEFVINKLKTPFNNIELMVNEGRVLLMGVVTDPDKAQLALDLTWKKSGVQEVIDEIELDKDDKFKIKNILGSINDYGITTISKAKILANPNTKFFNYKITTVRGNVYLIGVAKDQQEINKATSLISKIYGVKKVVNHIILIDDRRRQS